jgi:hypothetical protein
MRLPALPTSTRIERCLMAVTVVMLTAALLWRYYYY